MDLMLILRRFKASKKGHEEHAKLVSSTRFYETETVANEEIFVMDFVIDTKCVIFSLANYLL
ncbi:MAG: hypothetical protein ACI8RD_011514 [Bacillariaceae sp.]|jgi:hypothetical protein